MADTLSQEAIDSLFKGAGLAAPSADADVTPYNFLRPPRISRDRRAALEAIYTRLAVALQPLLSARLRQPTDVTMLSVEQATFGEYVMAMRSPCAAFVFELGNGMQGVLDISNALACYMVDRMFGGSGDKSDLGRPLTQLERLTVKGVADRALKLLGEVWRDHVAMTPVQVGFEASPEALQVAAKEDNVLVANIETRAGEFAGLLTIGLPLHALESFLQKAPAAIRQRPPAAEQAAAARVEVERAVRQARLDVAVRLPVVTLAARDVARLQPGQVIRTTLPSDVTVEVLVNKCRHFLGTPGQVRSSVGVRITQRCAADAPTSGVRVTPARIV
jgi:flagellar motor switch protein FliM